MHLSYRCLILLLVGCSLPNQRAAPDAAAELDADWIAFDSDRDGLNRDIYLMRADGSSLTRVTNDPSIEQQPAWSPDGLQLAFASNRDGSTMQIYTLDLATSSVSQVTHSSEGADQPAW